jgi:hypothetical protein
MEYEISGAEDVMERSLDLGLASSYHAPFFRELFAHKVA